MTSVLESWGMVCPNCYKDSEITITIFTSRRVVLLDDGTTESATDSGREVENHWNDDSPCACEMCDHVNTVADFERAAKSLERALDGTNCREAFPDFDDDITQYIGNGWLDFSYRNDTCPSVHNEEFGLQLYVDFINPDLREYGSDYPRFQLMRDDSPDDNDNQTDSLEQVKQWLANPESYK